MSPRGGCSGAAAGISSDSAKRPSQALLLRCPRAAGAEDTVPAGRSHTRLSPFLAQTLYNVRAEILPPSGTEHCRTGSLCSLEVSITRLSDLLEVDKDEALTESDDYFSTKLMYEGRSGGVFSPNCCATPRVRGLCPLFPQ